MSIRTLFPKRLPATGDELRSQVDYLVGNPRGRRRLFRSLVYNFALAVAAAQAFIWIFSIDDREGVVIGLVLLGAALCATYLALPEHTISAEIDYPSKGRIEVKVGDLLSSGPETIVVGISDRVDSSFPTSLHPATVIAQAWGGSGLNGTLDELQDHLWSQAGVPIGDALPIGTVCDLPVSEARSALVIVFARLTDEGPTQTTPMTLLDALGSLWREVHSRHISSVRIPVLGSGFGRADLPRSAIFSLIATSYRFALNAGPICPLVSIYVHPNDFDPEEFSRAKAALESVGFNC